MLFKEQEQQQKPLSGLSAKIKQISKSFKVVRKIRVWQYRTENSDENNFN